MTGPLQFELRELTEEVKLMRKLAANFLDTGTGDVLKNVEDQLETLYSRREGAIVSVGVSPSRPIKTIPCEGGYERGCGGAYKNLFAEIVFKWQLQPLGQASKKPKSQASKKRKENRRVAVAGIASTVARLKINHERETVDVASWRMEFGDDVSPGAFFHAQIPDTLETSQQEHQADTIGKWPHWLPVPRLPIPALTPMLGLEFTLAEIFQDRWPQHLASGGFEANKWRVLQQSRFVKYFEWQKENAEKSASGSPILDTKRAKPDWNMFLSRKT